MRKIIMLLAGIFILAGCSNTIFNTLTSTETIIDWVDFIKWDDKSYEVIYEGVLADESYIGEVKGTVKFKVADNVTNPNYKTKNGDAAFHEKGTEFFAVKDHPDLLAVKDKEEIGGYRLYYARDEGAPKWHFKDVPRELVKRIEFYSLYTAEGNKQLSAWENPEDLDAILQLLATSKEQPDFSPNTTEKDPDYYNILLYAEGPIAYRYNIQFDGETYYWFPWDTHILPASIKQYIAVD